MVRIWVVDDHPRSMEFLTQALPVGYAQVCQITLLASFAEWEELLPLTTPHTFPHIIFLDYYLPEGHTGEDVFQTLSHFLAIHSTYAAPLLIGYSSTATKNLRFQELGISHTVHKFTPSGTETLTSLFPTLDSLTHYAS